MTVQTNTNVASFNGNGVTQIFPIAFKFNNDTDLVVLLVDDATGAVSQLTLNSDYTVSGEGDEEGGLINVVVAPQVGKRLFVSRIVDILQLTDLRNQGKFFAEVHEDAFDLLTMIAQQIASGIRSSLRVPESDPEPGRIPAAALRAGKFLAFDQDGNPTTAAPVNDSAEALRLELASAGGAEIVGRGSSSVDEDLKAVENLSASINGKLEVPNGSLAAIVRESGANSTIIMRDGPSRVIGKALYDATYDHFGQMDALPDGQLYLIFRRAAAHTGGSDGNLMFSKLLPTGSWASPTLIADIAGQDFRDAAGGTMPSGRIICASTIYETGDLHVYASDDYGVSWTLKQTILKGSTDYRFAHGKGFQIGSKYVVPYYTATGTVFQLRWLETSDGGDTWVEGATVYSGPVDYNETAYLPLGGGAILGVARVGDGTGGKLRQFISTDGGTTWTDQGDVTAQNGDATDVLVAPSMSYVLSEGGTPHVVLFYTNRTAGFCYYRVNTVNKVIDGVTGWSDRTSVYSAPGSSGYSSQIVLGDRRILGNVYRELSLSAAGAFQFEVRLGELPDYESQWTAVAASTLYTFAHGLQRAPRRVVVEFATSTNPSVWFTVGAAYYNDGANKGSGAQVEIGATNIRVGTGSSVWGTGYFAGIDFAAGNRLASGFYRVRAWI